MNPGEGGSPIDPDNFKLLWVIVSPLTFILNVKHSHD